MKKRNLKSLKLNKKSISNFNEVRGGLDSVGSSSFNLECILSFYICDLPGTDTMVLSADYPCDLY